MSEMPVGDRPAFGGECFPMVLFEPHRKQAYSNHGQSLERLAERGGLSWCEAIAILEDRDWRKMNEAEKAFRAIIGSTITSPIDDRIEGEER